MNNISQNLLNIFRTLMRPLFFWIKTTVTPDLSETNLGIDPQKPILYVLPKWSLIDVHVLFEICREKRLPLPNTDIGNLIKDSGASFTYISKPGLIKSTEELLAVNSDLQYLANQIRKSEGLDVQIVPVSVLWGKDPGTEEPSMFKLLFYDDEHAGILQKLFIVLAHGRNNYVFINTPASLWEETKEKTEVKSAVKELQQKLKDQFKHQRDTFLGQKLYERSAVIEQIVNSRAVKLVFESTNIKTPKAQAKAELSVRKYAKEISGDQTYSAIRFAQTALRYVWNKMFDGIEIRNFEQVKKLADEKFEIVFVPNHRSHLDYLLVDYSIYVNGLPCPHTAAGINMNFWPIGGLLRRLGAFFLRRSFKGNRLYTAVFNEYLHFLLTNGYPIVFFPEGGRSRTGRLLSPKTGFLSMIVHSFLRNSQRRIALVPLSINYDKVIEVASYLKELGGNTKRKESFLDLLGFRKILSTYWGKAYIGIGSPIFLDDFLDKTVPDWKTLNDPLVNKPDWLSSVSEILSEELVKKINEATMISPFALISLSLLSSPQKAIPEDELFELIKCLLKLQNEFPYNDNLTLPPFESFDQKLRLAERLESFNRFKHSGGDVLYFNELEAIIASYYKNNILHLFALPSLVARFFQYNEKVPVDALIQGCLELYPFLRKEFFLTWPDHAAEETIKKLILVMQNLKLFTISEDGAHYLRPQIGSAEYDHLRSLARALGLVFERYTITMTLLTKYVDKGYVESEEFEYQCSKMSQKLAILNGISSPEAAERQLFNKYIAQLKEMGYLIPADKDKLLVDKKILNLSQKSKLILSPQTIQSIERMTNVGR
ncbi:MAG: glycerol-3-phosphate 1-O-acyltransferase PlsB [Oligoflexales bacterium]|nr:glycerol-3-phosphate 1-O-acyltransferase PlsB [Oligoflexales bacterium]